MAMAPKLFTVCFSWCCQCSTNNRKSRKGRSRRLICSSHSVAGRRGLVSRHAFLDGEDDDCYYYNDEDENIDEEEEEGEDEEYEDDDYVVIKKTGNVGGSGKSGHGRRGDGGQNGNNRGGSGDGGGGGSGRTSVRYSPKRSGYSQIDSPALTLRRRSQWSQDSSLDRVDGERRGSLPLVSGLHDSMESVSTTSRLAQFFSKKGFRSNLKRTKSVTKLENRKQSTPSLSEGAGQDSSSLMGSLKRTMSLGRLARKKKSKRDKENHHHQQQHHHHQQHPLPSSQQQRRASSTVSSRTNLINTPHSSPALSLISARIRSARSHESLLTSSHPSMHSINLSDPDVEVKPLHSSVLGQGHCFHVATSQGSKYVSCTTSEERDKWMYSLRRTARPNEEHCRRSDSSLKLWVVEAKNLPLKKRYYCHILLDRTLYAQTSVKTMTDMLFWGEHFEFKSLPVVEIVTINLFREADKKKKKDKDLLVGYINLAVEDLENRQMIEKWITCNSGTVGKAGKETKSELPIIRIKARKQKVDILPLDTYQSFIKYLSTDYLSICSMLESVLVVREKEEFATSLVNILQTQGKACQFLCDIAMDEIDRLEDEHLTFRGNSIATKAMEAYMKLVGEKYLQDTLGEFIRNLMITPDDCEVDPTKVTTPQLLECQQENLEMYCDMVWVKVINSFCYFPNEMREVFASLRTQCQSRGKSDYSDNLISGCIFLRFLCPAILYPNLFHLTQEYPQEKASRNLTLVAKTIQTLANFTKFGTKEEFMTFMNKFVQREENSMKTFLHKISSQDAGNEFLQYDGDIDLGKELSVLHCMLTECREKYAQKTSGEEFEQMNNFLNTLSSAFNDPKIGQKKPQRRSQIYDNMMNVPGMPASKQQPAQPQHSLPIDVESNPKSDKPPVAAKSASNAMDTRAVPSSPTEVLRDMLRHCGESMDDLPALAENSNAAVMGNTLPLRERSSSDNMVLKSRSRSRSYSGDDEMKKAKEMAAAKARSERPLVADVSVASVSRIEASQERINESWIQMVNAADNLNGDYIDLIPFMDEDVNDLSIDGVDVGNTTLGSQASVGGQSSTVGSSGYQSFSHSQSPVESGSSQGQGHNAESSTELAKSPVIQYPQSVQPLAFANPLFSHQQKRNNYHQPHPQHQYPSHPVKHQLSYRPPVVKSILNPKTGYAGATPSPMSTPPQPTPRQRHAKTVQRRSSDDSSSTTSSDNDDSGAGSNKEFRHHRKRGYKPTLRTTTTTTNVSTTAASTTTTMTTDYQTSIAPLKKLSQLSSSSSDDEGSNGTPLGYHSTTTHPSYTSNSVNRRQYSTSVNKPSSSPSSTHNYKQSLSSTQSQPFSSSTSTTSSSYQTTFPVTTDANNVNNNFTTINGCSTFPRKHARNKNLSYQDPNYVNIDNTSTNTSSPPLPPREALTSSSSPAVPPKTAASRNAFLQRQFSQQTYSSANSISAGDQPSTTSQRPTYPPRNPNLVGITTDKSGQFQLRHTPTSTTIAQRQQQLQHSISIDGSNKYATAPRPSVSRKPQKLIQQFQQPNQNSVETLIDSPPIDIDSYQSSPLHSQRRHSNKTTTGGNNMSSDFKSTIAPASNSNNNNSPKMATTPTPSSSNKAWQVARHMERQSSNSSHDTSSSSTESSPQSLLRSNNQKTNNSSTSMQDSSSTHSISSAPLSSQSHPWGLTTPPHSDSSCSSLSSLSHTHQQQNHHHPAQRPNRSGSSGSIGGTGLPLNLTENQTGGSVTSLNNNNNSISSRSGPCHVDNGVRNLHHQHHSSTTSSLQSNNHHHYHNAPPPNSPNSNSFASRLSSRSDGHINAISHQLQQYSSSSLTSSFSVANPIPHSPSMGSNNSPPPTPSRSLSYHSPTGSPNLSSGSSRRGEGGNGNGRSSYPASRSMDLSTLITKKPTAVEAMKRTSVDSLLSHPDSSLSPTGSLSRDADTDGGRSSASSLSSSNRRLSPQSAVHMGISSVQRKLQEQENTKKEYETEVHGLRQQLLEAQERLQQAEMRLLDHEVDTHTLMDQWQSRLTESEEKMRKEQEEKDVKMKEIITRLQSIEDELKREQEEMAQAVEQKQQVIEVQEQRIRTLDLANQKLLLALAELKGRALATQRQSLNAGNKELALEMAGLKTSSC